MVDHSLLERQQRRIPTKDENKLYKEIFQINQSMNESKREQRDKLMLFWISIVVDDDDDGWNKRQRIRQ